MAASVLVSVDEYLGTSYHPDCDYVDGEVVERSLPRRKHSKAQRTIMFRLADRYPELVDQLLPEQRVQTSATRFRVPDVCISATGTDNEEIVVTPPELCIEILSPEDTLARTLERIKDYIAMGVPACWIVDPVGRQGWIATPGRLDDVTDGMLRANGIEIPLSEVFE
jgi:Uma2 family endonuclease